MAAAVRLAGLWAVAAGALWLHALAGLLGNYLGQGYPLYPGLTVTWQSLALDAVLPTFPIAVAGALALWRRLRLLALPVIALLWLWAANILISPFIIDFGTTWAGTEPLRALFLHPVHTPLALAVLLATGWLTLASRPQPTSAP